GTRDVEGGGHDLRSEPPQHGMPGAQQVAHEQGAVALEVKRAVSGRVPGSVQDPRPARHVEFFTVADRDRVVDVGWLQRAVARHVEEESESTGVLQDRERASLALPRLLAGAQELRVSRMEK